MNDTLNPLENKEVVLAQIDALHEQHRLQKLRELVGPYRHMGCSLTRGIADKMEADKLICALWQNGVNIPPELTFGEPYDTAFKTFVTRYQYTRYHTPNFLYLLLRYADRLPLFMAYALQCNYAWIDDSHIEKIEEEIYDKIQSLPQDTHRPSIFKLQSDLQKTTLSRLESVYIAIMLDQIECFNQNLSLWDFVIICMR